MKTVPQNLVNRALSIVKVKFSVIEWKFILNWVLMRDFMARLVQYFVHDLQIEVS
jgi:hypothetical protein